MEPSFLEDPAVLDTINLAYFLVYVFLIISISVRIGFRYAMYTFLRIRKPYLIHRDLVLWGTVGVVVGLILYMRAVGSSPIELRYNFWWVNGTSFLVITGLAYYAYVEWFKIEGPLPRDEDDNE